MSSVASTARDILWSKPLGAAEFETWVKETYRRGHVLAVLTGPAVWKRMNLPCE